ncbi:MAG: hypothetical protein GYA55_15050 [SAR324 cluster bacterium]|uniref:Uncharacterized protein n=1 Tax=SAR324 cluster bacterium TaxID=2024889 RepID=A0A7X9FV62_9DELT|nr:hypothetical protein [SAR324 cluster bacterium]
MINSASSSIRIAPEILQASKELRVIQKQEEETKLAAAEPEAQGPKAPKPAHEGVGKTVDVEA